MSICTAFSFTTAYCSKNIQSSQCMNAGDQINCCSSMALLWEVLNRKHIGHWLCLWYLLASDQTQQRRCQRAAGSFLLLNKVQNSEVSPSLSLTQNQWKVSAKYRVEIPCSKLKLVYPSLMKINPRHSNMFYLQVHLKLRRKAKGFPLKVYVHNYGNC